MSMAEKFYYLEQDEYYPSSGSESNIDNINDNLKLQLSERYWDYLCNNAGCVQAERNGEYWHLSVDDSDGEVDSGACP